MTVMSFRIVSAFLVATALLGDAQSSSPVTPPHCTRPYHSQGLGSSKSIHLHFLLGLHTTVCFRLEDARNSTQAVLHTVTLAGLEHHHSAKDHYTFAIPTVRSDCFCECDSTDKCSPAKYEYQHCEDLEGHGCYRTFFPNQPRQSCEKESPSGSNLCCDVKFSPLENKKYSAFQLGSPSTFAIFRYTSYEFSNNSWIVMDENTITIQIGGGSQENNLDKRGIVKLVIFPVGTTSNKLDSGMFFSQLDENGSPTKIRLGDVNSRGGIPNIGQLGWYRQNASTGHYYVHGDDHTVKFIHRAKVEDCSKQLYNSSIHANYWTSDQIHHGFTLPPALEEHNHWIERAYFADKSMRQLIVSHSSGANLNVDLHVGKGADGTVVFHQDFSRVDAFDGSILLDSNSRLSLKLKLIGATGKLNAVIHSNESANSDQIHAFTFHVHTAGSTNASHSEPLPAFIGAGNKLVCLTTDDQDDFVCAMVAYNEEDVEKDMKHNSWKGKKGDCASCNKRSYCETLASYTPLSRFISVEALCDGVSEAADFVLQSPLLLLIIGIASCYIFIAKFLIPLCECCICPILVAKFTQRKEGRHRSKTVQDMKRANRGSEDVFDCNA